MRPHPFLVSVARLRPPDGIPKIHETRHDVLDGLRVTGSKVPAGEPVEVDVDILRVESAYEVRGTVTFAWEGECARCLRPARGTRSADVREVFEKHNVDGETYPLRDDQVDLEPLARETVMLELPQVPLCREDCQGLCPTCGADRNEGGCDCPTEVSDPRWAALDQLRTDS